MNRIVVLAMAAMIAVAAISCKKDTDRPKPPVTGGTLSGVNKWIVDELEEWYYWNQAVQNATPPKNSTAYDEFLSELLLGLSNARDLSEDPPTIDGGYFGDGSRYLYSHVERTSTGTRAPAGVKTTFGFDVQPVSNIDTTDPDKLGLLVLWVRPGSPADEEGLERGDWIMRYNGSDIDGTAYEAFWYRLNTLQGGPTMNLVDLDGKEYNITAREMEVSPFIHSEVIASPSGKKVAYLMYNEFEQGPGGKFDGQMRTVFAGFKAAGATELIVDLRYNGGGAVVSSQLLSSLAGNVTSNQVFTKLLYNRSLETQGLVNPQVMNFLDEPSSMNLRKVYVIATVMTASSSELFINSLRGVDVEVVLIGETTEGKNVGMNPSNTTIGGYDYEMWPITFKSMNAKNFSNYAGGFTPTVARDELWDVLRGKIYTGELLPLGDPDERLVNAALTMIDGGTVAPDKGVTRGAAGEGARVVPTRLYDPRRGGMRSYTNPLERR